MNPEHIVAGLSLPERGSRCGGAQYCSRSLSGRPRHMRSRWAACSFGAGTEREVEPGAGVLRERVAGIDLEVLEAVRAAVSADAPAPLVLSLFSDVRLNGVITWTGPTAAGYGLAGHLEEWELGSVTLVVNDGIVMGTVRAPGALYSIRTGRDGEVVIRQVAPPLLRGNDVVAPPQQRGTLRTGPTDAAAPAADGGAEDGSQIDVLLVYTPAARVRVGGRRQIETAAALWETTANQAYRASGVAHRVRIVAVVQTAYDERRQAMADVIHRLGRGEGKFRRVHQLRERYSADLVTLALDHHVLTDRDERAGIGNLGGPFNIVGVLNLDGWMGTRRRRLHTNSATTCT